MDHRLLQAITDYGDSGVVVGATVVAVAALLALRARRAAARFAVTMIVAGGGIGLFKLLFLSLGGPYSDAVNLYSPSGHVALTTAFWGATATYVARGRPARLGLPIWLLAGAAVAVVATTRVALGYHSVPEVAVGFALGAASLLFVLHHTPARERRARADLRRVGVFLGVEAAALATLHGFHLPAEYMIRRFVG